jgi:preprotein translocase subunit SecA
MAFSMADKMQGQLTFAIVDEVDSILIDEGPYAADHLRRS